MLSQKCGIDIKRCHQKIRGACGLYHLKFILKDIVVDAVAHEVQDGALCKGCERLVYRVDNDIRALLFGGFGHIRIPAVAEELQVRTVRLIDYEDFAVPVDGRGNRLYVGAYAVVVRRRQYDGFGIGIFGEQSLHLSRGDFARNAVFLNHLGIGVDRLDSAEYKRIVD